MRTSCSQAAGIKTAGHAVLLPNTRASRPRVWVQTDVGQQGLHSIGVGIVVLRQGSGGPQASRFAFSDVCEGHIGARSHPLPVAAATCSKKNHTPPRDVYMRKLRNP